MPQHIASNLLFNVFLCIGLGLPLLVKASVCEVSTAPVKPDWVARPPSREMEFVGRGSSEMRPDINEQRRLSRQAAIAELSATIEVEVVDSLESRQQ